MYLTRSGYVRWVHQASNHLKALVKEGTGTPAVSGKSRRTCPRSGSRARSSRACRKRTCRTLRVHRNMPSATHSEAEALAGNSRRRASAVCLSTARFRFTNDTKHESLGLPHVMSHALLRRKGMQCLQRLAVVHAGHN